MRIVGMKYLNENNYKKIRIGHNEILVTKSDDLDKCSSDFKFTDTLKGMKRKQIIEEVIEYFLKNHNINSISSYEFSGNSINVIGDDKVMLKICVPIDMKVASKLMTKYEHDRASFTKKITLVDANICFFKVNGKSSYNKSDDNYTFCLSSKNDDIMGFEENFLTEFIRRMLDKRENAMTREEITDDIFNISFLGKSNGSTRKYFEYGAPNMIVDGSLVSIIEDIVIEHNSKFIHDEKVQGKIFQKRMEEFK